MMSQKRIPEAALSVHVCNPKYRSQGLPQKDGKLLLEKGQTTY